MKNVKLKPCPFCGKEIDIEKNMYIPERDWKPTFYDPDSGGDPIAIHCECGLEFSIGTYDYREFIEVWNRRTKSMARKPNLKDKIYGCVAFGKDMIIGILSFNLSRVQLDWCLICETIKGNYEIVEKEIQNV